jgi:hypothetical protein
MIKALNFLVKIIATILAAAIGLISSLIGFLLWDKRFMDGEYYIDWIWKKRKN